jgi:hypothetical protein
MRGRFQHPYGYWCGHVSVEHRRNDSQHYGQPDFNHNVFGHGNQFGGLLSNSISDRFRGVIQRSDGNRIAFIDMRRQIEHADRHWCGYLSMEYRGDNGHHYRQSRFDHNIFSYRNQFQRLLGNGNGNGFS